MKPVGFFGKGNSLQMGDCLVIEMESLIEELSLNDDSPGFTPRSVTRKSSGRERSEIPASSPKVGASAGEAEPGASENQKGGETREGKFGNRRSIRRRSSSWLMHPRRVLLLFATLSTVTSVLLIYLTLSTTRRK